MAHPRHPPRVRLDVVVWPLRGSDPAATVGEGAQVGVEPSARGALDFTHAALAKLTSDQGAPHDAARGRRGRLPGKCLARLAWLEASPRL